MATLNTLRTRGGVIVSVVIGIALLAFLLGDLSSVGGGMFNARKMRVGEINGNNIGYVEYSSQVDYFTGIEQTMSGKEALSTQDVEGVQNLAWEYMVAKYALEPGFQNSGLTVSETEKIDMVDGRYISPVITGAFTNPNTGTFDPNVLRNFVANLGQDQTGKASSAWEYLKTQMTKQRIFVKYMNLVAKGMYVANFEIDQAVALSNSVSDISYIMESYDQIVDSTINVSQEEVKKYYNDNKNIFRQTASRDIEYVVFDVLPSQADYDQAQKYISEISAEFAASESPMQYATLNSQTKPNKNYLSEKEIQDPLLANFVFGQTTETMYGPVFANDTYTMVRVEDTKMLPDSLGARHILLPAGSKTTADSVVTALKGGASFAELATKLSIDPSVAQNQGDLGIFNPSQMIPEFSDAAVKANKGEIFIVESQYGTHVAELTYKSDLTKKAQLATITYKVEPSDVTQQDIYAKASKFITDANSSYDNFKLAATNEALSKRVARVRNTDRNVNGLENSKELVRWAFTSDKNAVSGIMEIGGDYVVAALTGVQEDGIAPIADVSRDIAAILRQEKKGQMLAEKMKGTSVMEVAAKLGTEPKAAVGIDFNAFYIDGLGVEPKLVGAVSAAKPNTLAKPVAGTIGVFLFDVTNRIAVDNATFDSEKVRLEAMTQTYIYERISQTLNDESNVVDYRVKFF